VPRDEIFLLTNNNQNQNRNFQVLDLSQLTPLDDSWQIDTGVTSGADATSWDEISVDNEGRVDTCADDGKAHRADKPAAAVCQSQKQ
jgi:hypothetical protein